MSVNWIEVIARLGEGLAMLIVLVMPLELLRRWRRGQLHRAHGWELVASALPLLPTLLSAGLVLGYIYLLYSGIAAWTPWRIPTTPATTLLCVLLVDLLYYVDHRCGHRIRAYWAVSHSVHHSSAHFDQTTGLRVSAIDGLLSPWFYVPAVAIGFDPLLVAASLGFILGWQQWLHTELIDRLPWLDGWLNTPSNHRVHHGTQPEYLDKNYGAVLMIWDRLFGTWQAEIEKPVYGLVEPLPPARQWGGSGWLGVWKLAWHVHTHEAVKLWRELRVAPDWSTFWSLCWRPPGWQRRA